MLYEFIFYPDIIAMENIIFPNSIFQISADSDIEATKKARKIIYKIKEKGLFKLYFKGN
jgi:hypothetical protein